MRLVLEFVERLQAIGIKVELTGNFPWIYLESVNDKVCKEKFQGNHGFTAFFMTREGGYRWSDRREVFRKIREML